MPTRIASSSFPQSVITVLRKVSRGDHFTTCPESSRVFPSHASVLVKFVLPRFSVRPTAAKTCSTSNSMVCKAAMLRARSTTSSAHATSGNQRPSMRYPRPRSARESCNDARAISVTRMNRKGDSGAPWGTPRTNLTFSVRTFPRFTLTELCLSMFAINAMS